MRAMLVAGLLLFCVDLSECFGVDSIFVEEKDGRVTVWSGDPNLVHHYIVDPGPSLREVSEEQRLSYLNGDREAPVDIRWKHVLIQGSEDLKGRRLAFGDYSTSPPHFAVVLSEGSRGVEYRLLQPGASEAKQVQSEFSEVSTVELIAYGLLAALMLALLLVTYWLNRDPRPEEIFKKAPQQ